MITVIRPGPLTTVQDLGRPGLAELGVGRSGAADSTSFTLANRLVGNPESAATLEATYGGLRLGFDAAAMVAVTGAVCDVLVDGTGVGMNAAVAVPAGATLTLGVPIRGLRTYVAVRGGLDVPPVLGSRSTDLLSGVGPAPTRAGDRFLLGTSPLPVPGVDVAPVAPPAGEVTLRVRIGPRADWFTSGALGALTGSSWEVTQESNRIGLRLAGPVLARRRDGELPSEGMVIGALQVPPSGQPVLFLPDHPTTGGYPVIAVVVTADLPAAGQLRPGDRVAFRVS